eukprot:TRINITY_DN10624_c0_g1_i1.p1 TRINITY_DN10624_c0_g1~~TRINITY_DN10624_c0_g1_i1.p1  ORF type:complete len:332 (+),score=78.06 TRINITY_DN10624_c0_g1_i1:24-998(+)
MDQDPPENNYLPDSILELIFSHLIVNVATTQHRKSIEGRFEETTPLDKIQPNITDPKDFKPRIASIVDAEAVVGVGFVVYDLEEAYGYNDALTADEEEGWFDLVDEEGEGEEGMDYEEGWAEEDQWEASDQTELQVTRDLNNVALACKKFYWIIASDQFWANVIQRNIDDLELILRIQNASTNDYGQSRLLYDLPQMEDGFRKWRQLYPIMQFVLRIKEEVQETFLTHELSVRDRDAETIVHFLCQFFESWGIELRKVFYDRLKASVRYVLNMDGDVATKIVRLYKEIRGLAVSHLFDESLGAIFEIKSNNAKKMQYSRERRRR